MPDLIRGAKRWIAGLKPVRVPEAPSRSFKDLWPGDAARGARLVAGELGATGPDGRESDLFSGID